MRVLTHIKKLDDSFGQFLVRVSCPCGASRHIEPEALARAFADDSERMLTRRDTLIAVLGLAFALEGEAGEVAVDARLERNKKAVPQPRWAKYPSGGQRSDAL